MAFLRRTATAAETTQEASQTRVASRLLAAALEGVADRQQRLNVLDLGSGTKGTVDFFAELECPTHLVFADCATFISSQPDPDPENPPSFAQQVSELTRYLNIEPGLELDLILLWDYLHYMNLEQVEMLSCALQPHIHTNTRGYGFGTLHNDQGIKAFHYAIASEAEVFMRPAAAARLPYGHSQQALSENFICLRISRGTLLQEGHLELLLEP